MFQCFDATATGQNVEGDAVSGFQDDGAMLRVRLHLIWALSAPQAITGVTSSNEHGIYLAVGVANWFCVENDRDHSSVASHTHCFELAD